ncbi:hypothetical protein Cgig2_024299 [Carnegiea gigantea]|uniref:Uncharacterized protein n=1 Tax=Carnegiea gigantea TaxID=171969 RepID=A0A9Q1JWL4_9CARY|nr:hypothetical protein Cgig2_024299 [Carnegiea gigantea]
MSFHSQLRRAKACRNEATRDTKDDHIIVERNVQNNPICGRIPTQFTTGIASNIELSLQYQRLPNTSNETQQQSRSLEDDEEDDNDLCHGEIRSQHSQIPYIYDISIYTIKMLSCLLDLSGQYKVPRKNKADVKDKVPDHVIRDQWINLVNY